MSQREDLRTFPGLRMRRESLRIDPAAFGDALALEVSWKPCRRGGAGFRTHRLVRRNSGRLEFRPHMPAAAPLLRLAQGWIERP